MADNGDIHSLFHFGQRIDVPIVRKNTSYFHFYSITNHFFQFCDPLSGIFVSTILHFLTIFRFLLRFASSIHKIKFFLQNQLTNEWNYITIDTQVLRG